MAWQAAVCAAAVLGALPVMAMADSAKFSVAAQPLPAGLKAFAEQANIEILYQYDDISGVVGNAVVGELEKHKALDQLLRNTGLEAVYSSEHAVTVRRIRTVLKSSTTQASQYEQRDAQGLKSGGFRVAQVDQGQGTPPSSAVAQESSSRLASTSAIQLQEVVVTAEKREERLQDVPVPVSTLSAESLADSDQVRLQDYYSQIPGLSLSTGGSGDSELAIRGLTTGINANPSVGVTIDDVPYGASTLISNVAVYLPDLDPSDLSRIEVLRGPQGTLYGASSIGGLLKFVTADPSTASFSGRLQADINEVAHENGGPGYGVRGAVNVPLGETVALRMSGFMRQDPGYVDDVQTGQRGVNRVDTSGGHFAALWRPSDEFSVKLGALLQNQRADGAANSDPTLGDLRQSLLIGTGTYSNRVRLYTANINAELAGIKLSSITGYGINTVSTLADQTPNYGGVGGFADQIFGVTAATGGDNNIHTKKFSQELRASSSVGQLDWLVGGFYTHESSGSDQFINAANSTTGEATGLLGNFYFPSTFTEYAGFADLTWHFTDKFDVQLGGRESQNHQVYNETDSGPLIPISLAHRPRLSIRRFGQRPMRLLI